MNSEPRTYDLIRNAAGEDGIVCRFCGLASWNPKDVTERFCGHCHLFLGDIMWMLHIGGPVGRYKELREIRGIDLQRLYEAKQRQPLSLPQRIGAAVGRFWHRIARALSRIRK